MMIKGVYINTKSNKKKQKREMNLIERFLYNNVLRLMFYCVMVIYIYLVGLFLSTGVYPFANSLMIRQYRISEKADQAIINSFVVAPALIMTFWVFAVVVFFSKMLYNKSYRALQRNIIKKKGDKNL